MKKTGFWKIVISRYSKSKLGMLSFLMVASFALLAVFSPVLAESKPLIMSYNGRLYAPLFIKHKDLVKIHDFPKMVEENNLFAVFPPIPYSPYKTDLYNRLKPPSSKHLMGTDELGRDILARMIHGSRVSLVVGLLATLIAYSIGIVLGSLAGYFGGVVDMALSRFIEIVICFPSSFMLLAIISMIRPNVFLLTFIIGIFGWTGVARLVRGEFLRVRSLDYITAARISGIKNFSLIFRHIMPNALTPVLISVSFSISSAILAESSLSFLGFGVPAPTASWGQIMQNSLTHVYAWWLIVFPGFALFYTVLGFNIVGEIARDAIDPKSAL